MRTAHNDSTLLLFGFSDGIIKIFSVQTLLPLFDVEGEKGEPVTDLHLISVNEKVD